MISKGFHNLFLNFFEIEFHSPLSLSDRIFRPWKSLVSSNASHVLLNHIFRRDFISRTGGMVKINSKTAKFRLAIVANFQSSKISDTSNFNTALFHCCMLENGLYQSFVEFFHVPDADLRNGSKNNISLKFLIEKSF